MGTPVLRMRECCEGLMKPAQYDDSQSLCGRREGVWRGETVGWGEAGL